MKCLDASFCIDLLKGDRGAQALAIGWEASRERVTIPAPALTEFLRAGYRKGGKVLERSLELTHRLEVLPLDEAAADEAARIGGDLDSRGTPVGYADLLIAAVVRRHQGVLVTRDGDFQRIPGLHLETY